LGLGLGWVAKFLFYTFFINFIIYFFFFFIY
jgi:hypothetical protein